MDRFKEKARDDVRQNGGGMAVSHDMVSTQRKAWGVLDKDVLSGEEEYQG